MKTAKLIKKALEEDKYTKDITSRSFDDNLKVEAVVLAKEKGIVCGLNICKQVFQTVDRKLKITLLKKDGDPVCEKFKEEAVMQISGKARSILAAERTALNFLQHLSGVATETSKLVKLLNNQKVRIRDTRKTIPLMRKLDKYAVVVGGGKNQRKNLADQILFKDNHWKCLEKEKITLKAYFEKLRKELSSNKKLKKNKPIYIQIEAKTLDEVKKALEIGPDLILLDNMSVSDIKKSIKIISNKSKIEVSGGVNSQNIKDYGDLSVDYISLGVITHSASALDFSLEVL